ncbi:hypothetical protein jhhlp_003751 [Lomentospora prolificans]|uniref:Glutamine amidotransferase domain-containing protein n=1 Tax=Lomentospora prolificans TaxID=41688 RepID=A0A2N3N9Q8_9PEZI|nr:hypothetical protein jhhlp_003751 [Lomentospora prolificans]
MAPIRLAILEADTPQPETAARYGHYTGLFTSLLAAATHPSPVATHFTISRHHIVHDTSAYPALEDIDAILITGSKHSAYLHDEWIVALAEYTRKALDTGRIRVVGICFGHQIVGRALGAEVGKSDKGWEVAVTDVDLSEEGKKLFGLEKMRDVDEKSVTQRIQQMHRDEVRSFPPDAVPLGSTELCPVQAMYAPKRYISVQGHPEFTEDIVREISERRHGDGVFSDELYEDAMKRVGNEHDGVTIAKAIVRFLEE